MLELISQVRSEKCCLQAAAILGEHLPSWPPRPQTAALLPSAPAPMPLFSDWKGLLWLIRKIVIFSCRCICRAKSLSRAEELREAAV